MAITIDGTGSISGISAGGLPDGVIQPADLSTGAPSWTSGGDLSFNSGYGSVATAYGCRAWVNFNGTGTVAIRASGNVSSITDNGTGDYTVNFTTAMPDANYSAVITAQETSAGGRDGFLSIRGGTSPSTSAIRFSGGVNNAYFAADNSIVCVAIFR